MPALPSWLLDPLWDQFAALLPDRPVYVPAHPLGCHRPRIADRIVFDKLIQVLRFGCSYASIADCTCSATTIRDRRDEWIEAGIFAQLKQIARESYDRIVGLVLEDIAVDGCITKAPGGGECAGRSPGRPGQTGHETLAPGRGLRHPAGPGAGRGEPARLPAAGPHPGQARRPRPAARGHHRAPRRRLRLAEDPRRARRTRPDRARSPTKATRRPIQAGQRWHVERTNAWHNAFNRLQRCYERREDVIDAFFDLADAIITVRSLIRQAWTLYRWDTRPARRP